MNYTNEYAICPEIANAIMARDKQYSHDGDVSVTSLLISPREFWLKKRHAHELSIDVSRLLSSWEGNLIHDAIEMHDLPRVVMTIADRKVSGKADYLKDNVLKDYKTTSVWSYIYKSHLDKWEAQLNCYAYIYGYVFNRKIEHLFVEAYLTDWQKGKIFEDNYPKCKQVQISIPTWSETRQRCFLEDAVSAVFSVEHLADDDLPLCTPEEKWQRETKYALRKNDAKRATKLFVNEADAQEYMSLKNLHPDDYVIDKRPGECVKCAEYCLAAPFCSQKKREDQERADG